MAETGEGAAALKAVTKEEVTTEPNPIKGVKLAAELAVDTLAAVDTAMGGDPRKELEKIAENKLEGPPVMPSTPLPPEMQPPAPQVVERVIETPVVIPAPAADTVTTT